LADEAGGATGTPSRRRLSTLHLLAGYFPDSANGTEVFAHHLALGLQELGVEVAVAFHRAADKADVPDYYEFEGVPVHVLPALPGADERTARYGRRVAEATGFAELLERLQPEIVHFHGFSTTQGLTHLAVCRARSIKTVYTMHTPGQWCLQGSLLHRGREVCDGVLQQYRCSECRLRALGVPGGISSALAGVPRFRSLPRGRSQLARLATIPSVVALHREAWHEFYDGVTCVHALAQWTVDMVRRNGLPIEKARLVRSGAPSSARIVPRRDRSSRPLRVVFIGRFTETKGPDVLIRAVQKLPKDAPIRVEFWSTNARPDTPYRRRWLSEIEKDSRLAAPKKIPHDQVIRSLHDVDVCAVPSIWLETGPLTVLEAFAAGVPVLGSDLGGIRELVRDGVDGRLFPAGDSAALAELLQGLIDRPGTLDRLRDAVSPPRRMEDVARDMFQIYTEIATRQNRHATVTA